MILIGDIGGTKTQLALYKSTEPSSLVAERRFLNKEYSSFEAIVATFLDEHSARGHVSFACFGLAGVVQQGRAKMTNLPWVFDAEELKKEFLFDNAWLLNDLEAFAYGVLTLKEGEYATLREGKKEPKGNIAVVAAGTGLGEAGLIWDGEQYHPFASEGGHCDFSPRNPLEIGLLQYLLKRTQPVSVELVLSGRGLVNIYHYLKEKSGHLEPDWFKEEMAKEDPAAVITRHALDGRSKACCQALDLFIELYGAESGNMALKYMAYGGVYLGGGIAPRILPQIMAGRFFEAFAAKEALQGFLSELPIYAILSEKTALHGSLYYVALHQRSHREAIVK